MQNSIKHPMNLMVVIGLVITLNTVTHAGSVIIDVPGVDIVTNVGYFVSIESPDAITISANASNSNYEGSAAFIFESNIVAQIVLDVTETSTAGGTWTATASPNLIIRGITEVTITVVASGLDITTIPGGSTGYKVAELTISVLPLSV